MQSTNYPSNTAYGTGTPIAAAQSASPFVDPSIGAGNALKIRDLADRVCVFIPTAYNPSAKALGQDSKTQEQITCDLLVLDGGELRYGSNRTQGTPDTHRVGVPYYAIGVLTSHVNIVRALLPHVNKGVVLGRIGLGITDQPGHNRPWNLQPLLNQGDMGHPDVDPAALQRDLAARDYAAQVWGQRTAGVFINPTPELLNAPTPYPVQPTYAPTPYRVQPVADTALPCPPNWQPAIWATIPRADQLTILSNVAAQVPPGM